MIIFKFKNNKKHKKCNNVYYNRKRANFEQILENRLHFDKALRLNRKSDLIQIKSKLKFKV